MIYLNDTGLAVVGHGRKKWQKPRPTVCDGGRENQLAVLQVIGRQSRMLYRYRGALIQVTSGWEASRSPSCQVVSTIPRNLNGMVVPRRT